MRFSVLAPVVLFTIIGGLTPVFGKMAVTQWPWMTLAWMRFGCAGLLLAATARMLGRRFPLTKSNIAVFAGLGALCVPINQFGFLRGLQLANASHAGIFYALNPILVFWGALIAGQSRFRTDLLAASLLAFAGAAAVVLSSGQASMLSVSGEMAAGDLLLFLAIVSWSTFSVLSRPVIRKYGVIETLSVVFLMGALMHTPLALMDMHRVNLDAVTWSGWVGALYVTLVTSYINYMLWYWVITRHDITRIAVVTNCHFVVTVVVAAIFLGDPISGLFAVGCVLILGGIVLATLPRGDAGEPAGADHQGA